MDLEVLSGHLITLIDDRTGKKTELGRVNQVMRETAKTTHGYTLTVR